MSSLRRCSRPGCGKNAVATLTYAYADSTAVVGPLATVAEPHSWDLCADHAERITVPIGWEMLRVDQIAIEDLDDPDSAAAIALAANGIQLEGLDEMEELTALAEAVSEAGRITSGLVDDGERSGDPIEFPPYRTDPSNPVTSRHPIYGAKRRAVEKQSRRSHLSVVPDPSERQAGPEAGPEEHYGGRHRRD
ncbi:DUF3499 domain-containing protein [Corynebacterium guangdongense]|uniref:DUF3499 domain-containing protein n=1 Tax=Corynebacterium guangdongense TaxID=1783348 RepID=A0ABU1ZUT6_9CORY|nr:DUF3499 domain-containing protein [Corynebacterium guangdongense]MDR7328689.1 hypothetical protein [Corynebacterium guangdongense]